MSDSQFNFDIVKITRNEDGLINNGQIEYSFKENGSIDWRAMVDPLYLVPKDKSKGTDVSGLKDTELLILLNGTKELAQIRGYNYVSYNVVTAHPEYVMTSCEIEWIPNYETEGRAIKFQALADASLDNTEGFTRYYLAAMAENRAFVRCVRNFLKINIVSKEEIGTTVVSNSGPIAVDQADVHYLLEEVMEAEKIAFGVVKSIVVKEGVRDAENFKSISDIPKIKAFELLERIKVMARERKKKEGRRRKAKA
jgi:hypothetical protein